jgi:prevent-host-death family protein
MVAATEMKNKFGALLAQALQSDEPIWIERHGRQVAVLVSAHRWAAVCGEDRPQPASAWGDAARQLAQEIAESERPQSSAVDMVRDLRRDRT